MPIARVDVSAFERCESLRQDAEIRAAADAQNAATSNHERYLSPQASATATGLVPRIPASRPDLKAKKRRELKVKAWDSYLASCLVAPSALQSPPAEDPRLVLKTLDVPVDLALPTLLANGSTSLAFSLSLTPIPDDDFFVADEIGVPAWATDFFHLLSSTTFQTVESKKPPRQSRSVSLRPILFNELSANAAWLPNTETFKTAKESGKEEDVYLVRAENCLEARSSQLRGRTFIWNENEMKNGRRRVPLIAVRVSGKVVPVTIETVSFQDDETNLETPTMVTISDTTDLIFLAPTYLHPFHRPRPSNETNSLLLEPQPPTDPSHPFHSAFSNALHNANLFAQLSLPPPRTILLRGPAGVGKRSILLHSLRKESVAVHLLKLGPILTRYEEAEEEDEDAGDHVSSIFKQAMMTVPSCVVVSDAEVLAEKGRATARAKLVSQLSGAVSRLKEGVVVVGLAENLDRNPVPELFTVDVPVSPPSSSQRQQIVESLLFKVDPDSAQFAAKLAGLTPGFLAGDLDALVRTAAWTCLGKVGRGKEASVKIGWDELAGALAISKGSQGVSSEPRRMEEGDWESFGGYKQLIPRLRHLISTSLLNTEAYTRLGVRPPRGILLHGPSGTGKTRLAHLLASLKGVNVLDCDLAMVFSKYLGESESYLRQLFGNAKKLSPCVVLIDPLDSIAIRRSTTGVSGNGVGERILSTLLNEMDGVEEVNGVFVIGCTDRLEMVDEALLRPGRFDRVVEIHVPSEEDRKDILEVLRKKTRFEEGLVDSLVQSTEGWTGGELEGLVRDAAARAMQRGFDVVEVMEEDFVMAFEGHVHVRAREDGR